MKKILMKAGTILALAVGGVAVMGPQASAGTVSSTFNVNATVNAACTAVVDANVNLALTAGQANGVASSAMGFNIFCPGGDANVTVALGTAATPFAMVNGANTLPYSLCTSATAAACTGSYTPGTAVPSAVPSTGSVLVPVVAWISPASAAAAVSAATAYTQTVAYNITY